VNKAGLFEFLSSQRLGVLGTIAPDGSPQSALIGIAVTDRLEIVFDTLRTTRKYRNLVSNPAASFVVGWAGEITVQYEGEAREPVGAELAAYQATYFKTWPDITHFVIRPKWVRYSDYGQNPPVIEEFRFD
jgi:pyridoxine/pyridoxamine 5'-phosphate oxidase